MSGSSSQAVRVQNSKHSRPKYDDLTLVNPRGTCWMPNIRREERSIALDS